MYSDNFYCPEIYPYTNKTDWDAEHIPDFFDVKHAVALFPTAKKGTMTYKGRSTSLRQEEPYFEDVTIKPPHDLSVDKI